MYRICGEQVVPPQDDGTQVVVLSADDPRVYNYRPQTSVLEDVEDVGFDSHGYVLYILVSNTVRTVTAVFKINSGPPVRTLVKVMAD